MQSVHMPLINTSVSHGTLDGVTICSPAVKYCVFIQGVMPGLPPTQFQHTQAKTSKSEKVIVILSYFLPRLFGFYVSMIVKNLLMNFPQSFWKG